MSVPLSSSPDELLAAAPTTGILSEGSASGTGRFIVTMRPEATIEGAQLMSDSAGLRVANAADFDQSAVNFDALGDAGALLFPELGVAVLSAEPDQIQSMGARIESDSPILAIEPERFVYALSSPAVGRVEEREESPEPSPVVGNGLGLSPAAANYLRGYRDALDHISAALLGTPAGSPVAPDQVEATAISEAVFTWGLQVTRVHISALSGAGIKVAVLDTGFDLNHPDFAGRPKVTASFVPGQTVQDGHGHGTHCIGTACGPKTPPVRPRYGVAFQSLIHAGKVLSNSGSGTDGSILAGINWAIANGCAVISMSLGRGANVGEPFPVSYETAARAGLARGCLIIAAAGNESNRGAGIIRPVGHPASCPSIMAVGAVDINMQIASFSNRSINPNGGNVDIVGPGVNVRSTWPMPTRYRTISGTSMATPHVAGIAALYAQTSTSMRGLTLWKKLIATAKNIAAIPPVDDGAGLVQA